MLYRVTFLLLCWQGDDLPLAQRPDQAAEGHQHSERLPFLDSATVK